MVLGSFFARVFSLGLAFSLVSFFSPALVLVLIIFLGQAHFILAYWYTFERLGKWWRSDFFRLWFSAVVVFMLLGLFEVFSPTFWIVFAGALFVLHNCIDDVTLISGYIDWFSILVIFNGVLLLFTLELSSLATGFVYGETKLQVLAGVSFIITLAGLRIHRSQGNYFALYSILLATLSMILILVVDVVPVMLVLGCIILFHYFLWYVEYLQKLWGKGPARTTYAKRVLGVNLLLGAIATVAWYGFTLPGHEYFFSETYFFIWTALHIIFSFIPKDIKLF